MPRPGMRCAHATAETRSHDGALARVADDPPKTAPGIGTAPPNPQRHCFCSPF